MDIYQADRTLVCTSRSSGLKQARLRVLRDIKGSMVVAVDPVGVREGSWVFTVSGSAARYAAGDFEILTDLTIAGIIDHWQDDASNR